VAPSRRGKNRRASSFFFLLLLLQPELAHAAAVKARTVGSTLAVLKSPRNTKRRSFVEEL